jgi:hypothetical protein
MMFGFLGSFLFPFFYFPYYHRDRGILHRTDQEHATFSIRVRVCNTHRSREVALLEPNIYFSVNLPNPPQAFLGLGDGRRVVSMNNPRYSVFFFFLHRAMTLYTAILVGTF